MKLAVSVGDTFVTNRGRPILTFLENTSNCAHASLMAPCDRDRYALLGVKGYLDSYQGATATQSSDSTATGTSPRSAGSHSLAEPDQRAR
jgi:hypothetical protein